MAQYKNTNNYTGLQIDNYIERASRSVVVANSSTQLTANAVMFSQTDATAGDHNIATSNGQQTVAGLIQFKTDSSGNVTTVQQFYDGSTDFNVVTDTATTISSIPSTFTTWYSARSGNLLGGIIKFTVNATTTVTAIIYEQNAAGTKFSMSFTYNGAEYQLIMTYTAGTSIVFDCYQKVVLKDIITVADINAILTSLCNNLGLTNGGVTKTATGTAQVSFSIDTSNGPVARIYTAQENPEVVPTT